jgi:GTP-binding protein Era
VLGRRLNALVGEAVEGVDVVLHVVDAAAGVGRGDAYVYEHQVGPAAADARFCAVNKIDAVGGHREVPQLQAASELGEYDEIVPVSALRGDGLALLSQLILSRLPTGPPLFPEGEVSDEPLEIRLAELVREQALRVTREEVPHSVAVVVEEIEPEADITRIHAVIVVERDSQKGILIGKGGATLKTIGTGARAEIETFLRTRVFLDLRVKVMKEWQSDPKALQRLWL